MNPLIKLIRESLVLFIDRIDNGNCDLSEIEAEELVALFRKYTDKDECMSKYQASQYLNISRATFDNYISYGWLPKGKHQQGFKELHWTKKDLDNFKQNFKHLKQRK